MTKSTTSAHEGTNVATKVLDIRKMRFVLQKRSTATGQWKTIGMAIIGKPMALKILNKSKSQHPDIEWRTVPQAVADAYKQGWADAMAFKDQPTPGSRAAG